MDLYGFHSISALLQQAPKSILKLILDKDRQDKRIHSLLELARVHKIVVEELNSAQLDAIAHNGKHQGVIAIIEDALPQLSFKELLVHLAQLEQASIMVLDGITDPHNLGAIIRSCECFGVAAVILPKDNSAQLNATVAKVAAGALSFIPVVVVNNLTRALEQLQEHDFWVAGTTLDTRSVPLFDFKPAKRMAWVLGSEGSGIRRLVAESCDYLVSIPMYGQTQSLNVSVAAGVVLSYAKYLSVDRG